MWFFTADLHLNHSNIIKYSKRPFMNQVELGLMELVDNGSIPFAIALSMFCAIRVLSLIL